MTLHFYLGYTVLTLVFFRLVWGFVGGHWSRFIHFIPSPTELRAYIASLRQLHAKPTAGHNPLGALSVLTMLLVLLAQVLALAQLRLCLACVVRSRLVKSVNYPKVEKSAA